MFSLESNATKGFTKYDILNNECFVKEESILATNRLR